MARQKDAPANPEHFELWFDVAGERRHRRADNEGDIQGLLDEVAGDLRHAVNHDDSIQGEDAKAAAIEAAVGGIEIFKVTTVKESVPITVGE